MAGNARLQQLQALSQECRRNIKNARRNELRKQGRRVAAGRGTTICDTTVAIYIMSGSVLDLAAQYWCQERLRAPCDKEDCSLQRGREIVADWIDNLSLEALAEAGAPTTVSGRAAQDRAGAFLARAGAAVWATRMIREQGHAPSTQELWEESTRLATHERRVGTAEPAGGSSATGSRQWGWRWRKTWGFRKGRLRVREHYDTDELRHKAATKKTAASTVLGYLCGLLFGPGKRSQENVCLLASFKQAQAIDVQIAGPKTSPRILALVFAR